MEPIALTVTFLDGTTVTVEAVAPDLIAFESKFDLSVAKLEKEVRLTHLFFLAWHALKRKGETSDEFEAWVNTVAGVAQPDAKKSKG